MRLVAALVFTALAFLVMASPALATKHAFVLANNAYDQLSDLQNTHADADAYGAAFEELGFDVTNHRDLSRAETLGAFDAFLSRVRPGDEVAFVYSGHGWSDGQGNYLVPTDAPRQGSDRRLRGQSLALRNGVNGVLDEIEALGVGLTVAVIDACRDNPFQPPEGRRSAGLSRGLAKVSPPQGTFVIFSAGEGQQALDRLPDDPPDQKLSVFSRVFVPNLTSGVTLEDAISETQAEVASLALRYDGHKQHPAYYDQTLGKTCLKGDCSSQPVAVSPGPSACDLQYEKAEELDACFAYEAYASSCPNHMFNAFARSYIKGNCAAPEIAALSEEQEEPDEKSLAAQTAPDTQETVAHRERPQAPGESCITVERTGEASRQLCVSSVLAPQGSNDYDANNLVDGDAATAWVEDMPGDGLGEAVSWEFTRSKDLSLLRLINGYAKTDRSFFRNARIRRARLTASTGATREIALRDSPVWQDFRLDGLEGVRWLRMEILETYPGTHYTDTALSEIRVK